MKINRRFAVIALAVFMAAGAILSRANTLIDVAFSNNSITSKTGWAATGITTNDFWNSYELISNQLVNVKFSDGTLSGVGLSVAGADGSSANGAIDPMYGVFIWNAGYVNNIYVTVTGLGGGIYNVYVYGHGGSDPEYSTYQLAIDAHNYGSQATTNGPEWISPQWQEGVQYVEWTNVTVVTGQTLTITAMPGGSYDAVLSGIQLESIGQPAPVAYIYTQPVFEQVVQGGAATFSVAAGGSPPIHYQWLFNNFPIAAATNSSYSLTNAQPNLAGNYSVIVSNAFNSVTSTVAPLLVVVTPDNLIDVDFTDQTITSKTGFAATGITATDIWNTVDISSESYFNLALNLEFVDGTSSHATLLFEGIYVDVYENGASDVMYNTYLSRLDAAMSMTITNLSPGAYDFYFYGHGGLILSESFGPDDYNAMFEITVGSWSRGIEATTNGPGWLSPIWTEGVQYVTFTNVSVSAGETVTINMPVDYDYVYSVIAGLQIATTSRASQSPFILTELADQSVVSGSNASFNIVAGGSTPLTYEWLFNNSLIAQATNSTYRLTNAQSANTGDYVVIVTNAYGCVTSTVAALNAIETVTNLISVAFTSATITTKTGFGATGVTSDDFWNTCSINSLDVSDLAFVDGSLTGASLVVTGAGGAGVNGLPDPMYGSYLAGNIVATFTNLPPATYDFYIFGHGNGNDQNSIFQLDVSSTIQGVEMTTDGPGWLSDAWQEGEQFVEFTNVSVIAGQTATITVTAGAGGFAGLSGVQLANIGAPAPRAAIITQPLSQTVDNGSNATFSVVAGGNAPYSYQWLFNGIAIAAATNNSYRVTNAQRPNAGGYSVVVTNLYGSATSIVARLILYEPSGALIDVDFTGSAITDKSGFAATGLASNDVWNTYPGNYYAVVVSYGLGILTNLLFSDGTISDTALKVTMYDYPAGSSNGAFDPMFGSFLYPSFGGGIIIQITNLSPGTYDFYLYGHGPENDQNSNFQLTSGPQDYGFMATTTNSSWLSRVWQNGAQYVEFTNVDVFPGQVVSISVDPPFSQEFNQYSTTVSGLQIKAAGPPLMTVISNYFLNVGQFLLVTNYAYSPFGPCNFRLASNAPQGSIISTNGLFCWEPTCEQGSTTNNITVWAIDSSSAPQSNSMSFTIVVNGCVEIALGSSVQQTGLSACVPINIFCTMGLTNVAFMLSDPSWHLADWSITVTNPAIYSASAQMVNGSNSLFMINSQTGQVLVGSNGIGSICFNILPSSSAFVSLAPFQLAASPIDSTLPPDLVALSGQVVVIGSQSLLQMSVQTQLNGLFTVYGNPGVTYELQATTNLGAWDSWMPMGRVSLNGLFKEMSFGNLTNNVEFFRVAQP